MNKTKKSGLLKIAGLMAAVTMLTTCVVSGTMAKYASTGTGSLPQLDVAKWSIQVGGKDIATESLDLSSLSWHIEAIDSSSGKTDAVETNMIAPGTWGYAAIEIKNEGNVDATVEVSIDNPSVSPAGGLSFKTVASSTPVTSFKDASGDLTNIELKRKNSGANTSITVYVCYQWLYEAEGGADTNDVDDTTIGTTKTSISFGTLTIKAEQVEPDKGV